MANRNWANSRIYTMHVMPVLLDCNFIVDSTNANGIRSLKGPAVTSVKMNAVSSEPAGSPALATARSYGILGASAVTNTGSSVITGNLGISPGTSVTGFPPGTFTGREDIANVAAANAKAAAQASYTDLQARSPTTIATELGTQSLTAGVYKAASGTFTLNGTLTLTGSATDIFVFQTTTTLVTGGSSTPVITLAGGALASNVYFVVGSSATINSGFTGTMNGTVIAQTSITDTLGGTVNGSLIALTGAVTLSAATAINAQTPATIAGSPPAGYIVVKLADNYARSFNNVSAQVMPSSGTSLTSVTSGLVYVITSLGTATLAQLQAKGLPLGVTPAVGVAFVATATGTIGGSAAVQQVMSSGSGIDHIETVGDPNTTLANQAQGSNGGGYMIMACMNQNIITAPADGTVISLSMYLSNSSILIQGE